MVSSIVDNIGDNIILIFFTILVFIVILAVLKLISDGLKSFRTRSMAKLQIDMAKLEMARMKTMMEDVKSQTLVLTEKEREKIEAIRTDNSVLTRKLVNDVNEIEERLKRLELGTDTYRAGMFLGKIKSHERRLFKGEK